MFEVVLNSKLQDTALYIIDNRPDLTAARICALYLQYKECVDPKLGNWTINIPEKQNIKKHVSIIFLIVSIAS